jgi:hypothetical protein
MSGHYAIRAATACDARDLAPRLRAADVLEIEAGSGRTPIDVLACSIARSLWSEALLIDGRVEALGGLGAMSILLGPGVPWLMGSDALTASPRWFLRQSRRQVERMSRQYGRLVNWVDARNAASIRYLGHLGFVLDPPAPWGAAGLPFRRFHKERSNV